MQIIESIITQNPCYTANRQIIVKGLMLHSVGCSCASAQNFINLFNQPTYDRACVHGFIDAYTGDVYQTLPWYWRGWHAGGSANNTHIGVEMCEPDCIQYDGSGAGFAVSNWPRAREMTTRTYNSAVELFAILCADFNLNPLQDGVIISHNEGGLRGWACRHVDPEHLWKQLKMPYTMDGFRKDVNARLEEIKEEREMTQEKFDAMLDQAFKNLAQREGHEWSKEAMDWAVGMGLIVGDDKCNTMPQKPLSREESAVIMKRFYQKFYRNRK